ncbi:hypothetical protein DMUE_3080 [Dictyocoela muelleri]|nr:hypothetical protein DMUE_3080 [Dictyocoela muelleri]
MIYHENIEIIITKRNKEMILYKGFSYHFRRENNYEKQWRCTDRKCSGMLKTTSTYSLIQQTSHVNVTNYGKNESLFHCNEKKEIINTREYKRDVVDKIL